MKLYFRSSFKNLLARVIPMRRRPTSVVMAWNLARNGGSISASFCPKLEALEDRSMPSLIASQFLPLTFPRATTDTVSVVAPALTASSPTAQQITLTDVISGAPSGGTVSFTVAGVGTVSNVPVVNGVARVVYTLPVGTQESQTGTVTASYSGTTGYAKSTSSGAGNGTLTFCMDGASTLLGTTLASFAVLAGSTVTNVGPTVIVGNVGVSPGSAVTGFPPGNVLAPSTIHINDGPAGLAQTELTTAYTTILNETVGFTDLTGKDLGGLTLTPGRYHFDTSAQLTGTLTLNDQNNPAARFDFQIGSTLTTASASRILFINGGADNVYWQVGTSAILGSSTVFAGNIMANASISMDSTASIACGRALARTGAVTLIDNFIDPAPKGPTIVTPAAAAANIVTSTSTVLSVQGATDTGAASLRYTWSTISAPAASATPSFSDNGSNGAQSTTVTFHAAGIYKFRVTISDAYGLATTSDVAVVVKQSLTSIQVKPSTATLHRNQLISVTARAFDQFGAAMTVQPSFSWSLASGGGSISSTGLYRSSSLYLGAVIIRASNGQVSGTAAVTVIA